MSKSSLIIVHVIVLVVLVMITETYKIDQEIGARIKRKSNSSTDGTGGFSIIEQTAVFCPEGYQKNSTGHCWPKYDPQSAEKE